MHKTNSLFKLTTLALAGALAWGCLETGSNDNDDTLLLGLVALDNQARAAAEAAKQCVTEVDDNSTFDLTTPLELCSPVAGSGRHFRFETVGTNVNNGYLNLLIGYGNRSDATNFPTVTSMFGSAATTNPDDGRWRIFFGKSQSCDQAWFDIRFSGINGGIQSANNGVKANLFTTANLATSGPPQLTTGCVETSSGIWGPSTTCMDISKGASDSSPRITIWATGINGADCNNLSTLNDSTKLYEKKDWTSLVPTTDDKNYIYRNLDGISVTRIVVRSETAIRD